MAITAVIAKGVKESKASKNQRRQRIKGVKESKASKNQRRQRIKGVKDAKRCMKLKWSSSASIPEAIATDPRFKVSIDYADKSE